MGAGYRTWDERRKIIRAIIAEKCPQTVDSFNLSESEEVYFRARTERAIDKLARDTSKFRSYYALPTAKPFGYVVGTVALIVVGAGLAAVYLWLRSEDATKAYPLFAALGASIVAAIGWAVAGGISHRNTVRQNTNTMLFARFSHAPFGDALNRFHGGFGHGALPQITKAKMDQLRASEIEDERKLAASVSYILNYYELLSSGVLRGDLDQNIVRDNVRGLIIYYFDKCAPHIRTLNMANARTYENLIKMRTHYREP